MRDLPATHARRSGQGAMQLGGVVWSLMGNLDLVTVGVLLGASAAGMYGAALRVAEVSIQFLVALSVIYLPEATRLAVAGRTEALRSLYRTTSRWATLVSVLAAGVGFVAAPELAQIVFRSNPATETTLMRILFVGYAVHGALGQTYSTLLALGAYADIWRSSIVSLPIIVAGTVGLTAAFGTEGAAWSTCLAYALTGLWWAWQVRRALGTGPFDEFYPRALGAAAVSLLVAAVVSRLGDALSPVGLIAAIMLAATAAWGLALVLSGGLSPSERSVAVRLLAKLRSGRVSA
jgi:O-antigen/teichoic acid export membrane protein